MRALEILNKIYTDNDSQLCVELPITYNDVYEAIAELEEAIKPKTCKLCAYCEPFNSVCFNDKSPLCADFVNSEYGCIYWERKDNA